MQQRWELSSAQTPPRGGGSCLPAGKVRSFCYSLPPPLTPALACITPAVLALALQTVPANGLMLQPEHNSHIPGTSVQEDPCLLTATSAASFSFMSHLESLTLTPLRPVCLRCTLSLSRYWLLSLLPTPKSEPSGGPDYDVCKLQDQMATWC